MCEILYARSKHGRLDKDTIRQVMKSAQEASESNPDGCGVFNENGSIWKTEGTVSDDDIETVADLYSGSQQIVVHLRYGTVGHKNFSNVHPFRTHRFTLVHNGRMNRVRDYGEDGDADSKKFLHKLTQQEGDAVDRIESALKTSGGWYSIFTLDRETGDLYYFRNRADFEFGHTDDHLYGATKSLRLDDITNRSGEHLFARQEPEEEVIYKVTDGTRKVGEFDTTTPRKKKQKQDTAATVHYRSGQDALEELYEDEVEDEKTREIPEWRQAG